MVDATIPTTQNALYRYAITAGHPTTIQVDSLWPTAAVPTYTVPQKAVKVICHMGGLIFARPGTTCTVDDPAGDIIATGGYTNVYPNPSDHTLTVISDTDSVISIIRRP